MTESFSKSYPSILVFLDYFWIRLTLLHRHKSWSVNGLFFMSFYLNFDGMFMVMSWWNI